MLGQAEKKKVLKRLNKISGQVAGIKKMVAAPRYCVEILTQIAAVRSALDSVGRFLLEDHLRTCVAEAIRRGGGKTEISELLDIFQRFK